MTLRRTLLAALAATPAVAGIARAAAMFENLLMFIPAGPGGGWDGTGRAVEQAARSAGLVTNFQFENVGGAGGMVGLPRFVNQRKGNGNALLVGGSVMVGAGITNKSPVTISNVVPIARLTEEAGVVVVPANSPFKDMAGLAAALKANPGAVPIGGGSAGGTDHIVLGLVLKALGRKPSEASYVAFAGGGPANAAILGGQVGAGISGFSEFSEQIKAGRMRALAVSSEKRFEGDGSDIPTLKEAGIDVVAANWRGVFGAPGVSDAQKAGLVALMTAIHGSAAWKEILKTRGWTDTFLAGDPFATFLKKEITDTEVVLKDLGLA